jgi:hypothetical protein
MSVDAAEGETYGPMLDWSDPDRLTFASRMRGVGSMDLYRLGYRMKRRASHAALAVPVPGPGEAE